MLLLLRVRLSNIDESVNKTVETAPKIANDDNNVQNDRIENEPTECQRLLDAADQTRVIDDTISIGKPSIQQEVPPSAGPIVCHKTETNLLSTAFGSVATIKSIDKSNSINCRMVLWYITFFGFMINYMYRININIAIVGMVASRKTTDQKAVEAACVVTSILNGTLNYTEPATESPLQIQVNHCNHSTGAQCF